MTDIEDAAAEAEMSLTNGPPAPSIISSIEPRENYSSQPTEDGKTPIKNVPIESTPLEDPREAVGETGESRELTSEDRPAGKPLPIIKFDRSKLAKRAPKASPGPNVVALQKTLLAAVDGQKIKIIEQLLDRGIPLPTEPERNCMAKAVYHGDLAILKLLLDFGVDPDARNEHGQTPLRTACDVRILLKYGANRDISAPDYTAMPCVIRSGNEIIVSLLLRYGSNPDFMIKNGYTSLTFKDGRGTVFSALTTAISDNHLDIVKLTDSERLRIVLDAGADVNLKFKGTTALMKACEENRTENVKLLLRAGANMDAVDDKGNTAMDLAANKGHDEIMMLLLAGGLSDIRKTLPCVTPPSRTVL